MGGTWLSLSFLRVSLLSSTLGFLLYIDLRWTVQWARGTKVFPSGAGSIFISRTNKLFMCCEHLAQREEVCTGLPLSHNICISHQIQLQEIIFLARQVQPLKPNSVTPAESFQKGWDNLIESRRRWGLRLQFLAASGSLADGERCWL